MRETNYKPKFQMLKPDAAEADITLDEDIHFFRVRVRRNGLNRTVMRFDKRDGSILVDVRGLYKLGFERTTHDLFEYNDYIFHMRTVNEDE